MLRIKMFAVALAVMAALGAAAGSAMARWTSLTGALSGVAEQKEPGTFTYEKGATVKCATVSAVWNLNAAKEATTLLFTEMKWNTCEATLGSLKASVTVACKGLQLKQPNLKEFEVGVSALEACTMKVGEKCLITVPGSPANQNLHTVTLSNEGLNQIDKFNLKEDIEAKATKATCGLTENTATASLLLLMQVLDSNVA